LQGAVWLEVGGWLVDAVVALACACTRSNLLLALSDNRSDSLPDVASDSDAPDSYASDSDASDRIGIGIGALSVVSDSGQQFGVQQGTTSQWIQQPKRLASP